MQRSRRNCSRSSSAELPPRNRTRAIPGRCRVIREEREIFNVRIEKAIGAAPPKVRGAIRRIKSALDELPARPDQSKLKGYFAERAFYGMQWKFPEFTDGYIAVLRSFGCLDIDDLRARQLSKVMGDLGEKGWTRASEIDAKHNVVFEDDSDEDLQSAYSDRIDSYERLFVELMEALQEFLTARDYAAMQEGFAVYGLSTK